MGVGTVNTDLGEAIALGSSLWGFGVNRFRRALSNRLGVVPRRPFGQSRQELDLADQVGQAELHGDAKVFEFLRSLATSASRATTRCRNSMMIATSSSFGKL